jgi:hypothetical protein
VITTLATSNRSRKRRSSKQARMWNVWRNRQSRIQQRLDKRQHTFKDDTLGERPVLQGANVQVEVGSRHKGIAYGGVAVMRQLVRELRLARAIDERLNLHRASNKPPPWSGVCGEMLAQDMGFHSEPNTKYGNVLGKRFSWA